MQLPRPHGNGAALQPSPCLVCGSRGTLGQLARHTSHLHLPGHIQEQITDNSFPPEQRGTRWLQKIPSASEAAYGILINNRLIDLSPLKNLICLCRGSATKQWQHSKGFGASLWRCPSVTLEGISARIRRSRHRGGIPQVLVCKVMVTWKFQGVE